MPGARPTWRSHLFPDHPTSSILRIIHARAARAAEGRRHCLWSGMGPRRADQGLLMMRPAPPIAQGLYDPRFEHDSCGVGFVVDLMGRRSHELVRDGLT